MDAGSPPPAAVPSAAADGKPAVRPSRTARLLAYRLLLGLALAIFALDQASKVWIAGWLPYVGQAHVHDGAHDHTVIRGFFYLIHVGNTGAAWSMFSGRGTLLAILAGGTLAAIFFWRRALGLRDRATQLCFGLLCGGIAGNFVDRLRHGDGHVTDFLDFHFGNYVYPTFNVADSGICVGVILYLLLSLRAPK
ncbi:MAG: signal peptidase [Verrucomicrobiota bacterium]|jgi:signal peptidase II